MLDWTDAETVFGLRTLRELVLHKSRPLCIWVGAGASRWCGYQGWREVAELANQEYVRHEASYEHAAAADGLTANDLPAVFAACRRASLVRYNTFLARTFAPKTPSPVYRRFIAALTGIRPLFVLTTNVDELLEKNLPDTTTLSRFDMERASALVAGGAPFVAKLHGSIGDVSSIVFTTEDYDSITSNRAFQESLRRVLRETSVLFVGYGAQDRYLLELLDRNKDEGVLFGDGPHFVVTPDKDRSLPSTVHRIRYSVSDGPDHRCAISVLEDLTIIRVSDSSMDPAIEKPSFSSGHFLHELFLPGAAMTSQTIEVGRPDGTTMQVIVGEGFSQNEMPNNTSRALHDVVVGLLCFDKLFAPVFAAGKLHLLLGSPLFWKLVTTGVLNFVSWKNHLGIVFPSAASLSGGELNIFAVETPDGQPDPPGRELRRQIAPAPGREREAEDQLQSLERKIIHLDDRAEGRICSRTLSLLLRGSVRAALSISEGTPISSIARWQMFPVLRLATLVRVAGTCSHLGIPSARLNVGIAGLAGPAFSLTAGAETTDDAAGYVVAGSFASDLGAIVQRNPAVLDSILSFRETATGTRLRQEILQRLSVQNGYDAALAINAGLKEVVPSKLLQEARDEMTKLFVNTRQLPRIPAAFWSDVTAAQGALDLWRARTKATFTEACRTNGIGPYDPCPCKSGEKTKFCCGAATS